MPAGIFVADFQRKLTMFGRKTEITQITTSNLNARDHNIGK